MLTNIGNPSGMRLNFDDSSYLQNRESEEDDVYNLRNERYDDDFLTKIGLGKFSLYREPTEDDLRRKRDNDDFLRKMGMGKFDPYGEYNKYNVRRERPDDFFNKSYWKRKKDNDGCVEQPNKKTAGIEKFLENSVLNPYCPYPVEDIPSVDNFLHDERLHQLFNDLLASSEMMNYSEKLESGSKYDKSIKFLNMIFFILEIDVRLFPIDSFGKSYENIQNFLEDMSWEEYQEFLDKLMLSVKNDENYKRAYEFYKESNLVNRSRKRYILVSKQGISFQYVVDLNEKVISVMRRKTIGESALKVFYFNPFLEKKKNTNNSKDENKIKRYMLHLEEFFNSFRENKEMRFIPISFFEEKNKDFYHILESMSMSDYNDFVSTVFSFSGNELLKRKWESFVESTANIIDSSKGLKNRRFFPVIEGYKLDPMLDDEKKLFGFRYLYKNEVYSFKGFK
jgi:hypothetical protein